jgi:hypothetical protein
MFSIARKPPARAPRRTAAFLAVLLALVPLAAIASSAPASAALGGPGVPVMGPSTLTAAEINAWYNSTGHHPNITVPMPVLASYYVAEGNAENVRGDIAFAQSIVETGYFGFVGSIVQPSNNNFAGMGACDTCNSGVQFPNADIGVRAQIQHLRNYADITSRAANLHHPPVPQWYAQGVTNPVQAAITAAHNFDTFFAKGRAPTWNLMGNGNWATAPTYAVSVLTVYNQMLVFNGKPGTCPPDGLGLGGAQAVQCPPALRSPGRSIAASPFGGYYTLGGTGGVRAVGNTAYASPSFPSDLARDIAMMPDGLGYVVLDGYGGLHKVGSATKGVMGTLAGPNFGKFDIARSIAITSDGKGIEVLDGYGGVHAGGTAPKLLAGYWRGWDIARAIAITPDNHGIYVLDGYGGVHTAGSALARGGVAFGRDLARDLMVVPGSPATRPGTGYEILDGFGGVHRIGIGPTVTNSQYVAADRYRGISAAAGHTFLIRNDGVVVAD